MKKVLLTLLFGGFLSLQSIAQCVPDTNIKDLIVPPVGTRFDTINKGMANERAIAILPYAYVGQNYTEVMQFKVPSDTTDPNFGTVPVNHVRLDSMQGLPNAFTLGCTPSNCKFPGGSFGCVQMSGVPTMADSISLEVAITYNITFSGLPTPISSTLDGYYLVIKNQPISLPENAITKNHVRVYPNPARDNVTLNFEANGGKTAQVQISSIIGTLVYDKVFTSNAGENKVEINTSSFKPGIYMYSLKVDNKNISGRFTISR